MIPYFHAAGHFSFAKSTQLYCQDMKQLQMQMDLEEFEKFFEKGFFSVRRTNKFFAGTSTLHNNYGENFSVVFDGYEKAETKSMGKILQ